MQSTYTHNQTASPSLATWKKQDFAHFLSLQIQSPSLCTVGTLAGFVPDGVVVDAILEESGEGFK